MEAAEAPLTFNEILDRGERAAVSAAVATATAEGAMPVELAQWAWRWALSRSRLETRGARWSHALLALGAASALDRRLGPEHGRAALANAIDFLCCSRPAREGSDVVVPAQWEGATSWHASIRNGSLERADGQLVDLLGRSGSENELATAWFQAGSMTAAGWGHGAIGARTFWSVAAAELAPRESLLRAGLRLWVPFEETADLSGGLGRWANVGLCAPFNDPVRPFSWRPSLDPATDERVEDHPDIARLTLAILEGRGEQVLGEALLAGTSPRVLAVATCIAACRVVVARPGLRQVHGLTFSRALFDAVSVPGVDVLVPLWLGQQFVAESWRLAVRSGRVVHPDAVLLLHEPPVATLQERASAIQDACRLEAVPAYGHTLKLCDACLYLESALPLAYSGWPMAALLAVRSTWSRSQRPWLALRGVMPR